MTRVKGSTSMSAPTPNSKTCWLTSQRSVFDEKIRCNVCVEEAYYATNNGLARPFSSDRRAHKVPWLSRATRSKDSDRRDKGLVCSCVLQVPERRSW